MPKKPNQPTPQERRRSRKAFRQAMTKELREHRSSFLVFSVLRVLILVALVRQLMRGSYESAFFCVLALVLLYLPSWLQVKLRVELPPPLEITILCFIFAAEILGEVNAFYVVVPNWDTMLHTLNGFLAAAVGLSMVILLNDNEKVVFDLSPFFLALLAFCFSMTIGVLWEFFECAMDQLFLLDMQKDSIMHSISSVMLDPTGGNTPVIIRDITDVIVVAGGEEIPLGLGGYLDVGILDTMKDLAVNFVGAVIFSFIGYFYVKNRGRGWFARRFIPRVVDVLPEDQEHEKNSSSSGE